MSLPAKCIDCGVETMSGAGSARCPSCWDDKCGEPTPESKEASQPAEWPERVWIDPRVSLKDNDQMYAAWSYWSGEQRHREYLSLEEHEARLKELREERDRLIAYRRKDDELMQGGFDTISDLRAKLAQVIEYAEMCGDFRNGIAHGSYDEGQVRANEFFDEARALLSGAEKEGKDEA